MPPKPPACRHGFRYNIILIYTADAATSNILCIGSGQSNPLKFYGHQYMPASLPHSFTASSPSPEKNIFGECLLVRWAHGRVNGLGQSVSHPAKWMAVDIWNFVVNQFPDWTLAAARRLRCSLFQIFFWLFWVWFGCCLCVPCDVAPDAHSIWSFCVVGARCWGTLKEK